MFSRKALKEPQRYQGTGKVTSSEIEALLSGEPRAVLDKRHLVMLLSNTDRAVPTKDNRIEILLDGTETFPAMLESIRNARRFIHMQFYRFDLDELGMEFIRALEEKAGSGIEVRIIFDDVGSWNFPSSTIKEMKSCGVQIFPFLPVRFPMLTNKINYRNHRKIMVIDGEHGYIGGINIARKYLFGLKDLGKWRDTHLRITGAAVDALNSVFLTDWFFVSGIVLVHDDAYFGKTVKAGNCFVQVTSSGPDSDWASIMQVYFAAISTARKSVYISTPYFSPDDSILTAIKTASLSGAEVKMIFPARSDSAIANWNTKSYISELLEAGVEVYLYGKGFNHSKYMVVDDVVTIVGSANVDMRSFDLNFEVVAVVCNENFASEMTRVFNDDLAGTDQVLAAEWERRSRVYRYKESLARILGPLY
ncbi:MAG: cardiolipin synthase [Bacteroidetes bacterium]|nr:cardiolipin synthase [Bacteroidota bacterium]